MKDTKVTPEERYKRKFPKPNNSASLEAALRELKVTDWNYLLIGDGSGTTWNKTCGWGCWLVENSDTEPERFWGGFSSGTNIIAEVMAYVQPLITLSARKNLQRNEDHSCRVVIITDCDHLVQAHKNRLQRKSHKAIWSMFDTWAREGIFCTFRHWKRNDLACNRFAHEMANDARRLMQKARPEQHELAAGHSRDMIYDPERAKRL